MECQTWGRVGVEESDVHRVCIFKSVKLKGWKGHEDCAATKCIEIVNRTKEQNKSMKNWIVHRVNMNPSSTHKIKSGIGEENIPVVLCTYGRSNGSPQRTPPLKFPEPILGPDLDVLEWGILRELDTIAGSQNKQFKEECGCSSP